MYETRFDLASRAVPRLDPTGFLLWLLGDGARPLRFRHPPLYFPVRRRRRQSDHYRRCPRWCYCRWRTWPPPRRHPFCPPRR